MSETPTVRWLLELFQD